MDPLHRLSARVLAKLIQDHGDARAEPAGASIEEISADFSGGRDAFITLRCESMVGNHLNRLDRIEALGANLGPGRSFSSASI